MRHPTLIICVALLTLSACSGDSDSTGTPSQRLFDDYVALVEGGYVAHIGSGYAMSNSSDRKDCDLGTPLTRAWLDGMMATWGGSVLIDSPKQFCGVINGAKHCLTRLGEASFAWHQWSPPGTTGGGVRIDVMSRIDDTHLVAFRSMTSLTPSAQVTENAVEAVRRDDNVTAPGHCPTPAPAPLTKDDLGGHWQGHRIIYDINTQSGSIEAGHQLQCAGSLCDLPTDGLFSVDLSHFHSPGSWRHESSGSNVSAIMSDSGQSLAVRHCADTGSGQLQFQTSCRLYAFTRAPSSQ